MVKIRHILFTALCLGLTLCLSGCKLALLNPKGIIAADEKSIMITSALLMLIVVIPVIILTFVFAWRYRESNTNATYSPDWAHSTILEIICWSIPCAIIVCLGIITWNSSVRLDPYKPLASNEKPLVIQVVSLEWKWLFIYPEQDIATINYVQLPVGVPVKFLISAEGPMNSFQIPQLGSQIYAMAGMQTKLNLIASEAGDYQGISANFTGDGFSEMKFTAHVSSKEEFAEWVKSVKQSPDKLTMTNYNQLIRPSENNAVKYYSAASKDIFETVVMRSSMPMPMKDMENESNQKNISVVKK